jgi:hypothetical protein
MIERSMGKLKQYELKQRAFLAAAVQRDRRRTADASIARSEATKVQPI